MRHLFRSLAVLIVLLLIVPSFGADNYSDYNTNVVNIDESYASIRYYGSIDISSDQTGNFYTQPFKIADCNENYGYLYIVVENDGSAEDVNVFVEVCDKPNGTWVTLTTDSDLDALANTAVADTLGIAQGADALKCKTFGWARLKLDGQSGNDGETVNFSAMYRKDSATSDNLGEVYKGTVTE